jgi:hypothetical protein
MNPNDGLRGLIERILQEATSGVATCGDPEVQRFIRLERLAEDALSRVPVAGEAMAEWAPSERFVNESPLHKEARSVGLAVAAPPSPPGAKFPPDAPWHPDPSTSPADDARDAARYRWLKDCNLCRHEEVARAFELGDAHLDEAIDAAMTADQAKGKNDA